MYLIKRKSLITVPNDSIHQISSQHHVYSVSPLGEFHYFRITGRKTAFCF